jgi:hypothetical protein
MSRIYEALKNTQQERSNSGLSARDGLGVMEMPECRGNARSDLDIDLTVYGHAAGKLPFYEQAKAVSGNADGGIFLLVAPVLEGQDLLLINDGSCKQEQICRVVSVTIRDVQASEVEVVFPYPNREFWALPDIR